MEEIRPNGTTIVLSVTMSACGEDEDVLLLETHAVNAETELVDASGYGAGKEETATGGERYIIFA